MQEMSREEFEYWEEKVTSELKRNETKTKVTSVEIVVHGTVDKPYFELKYTTMDGEIHIGYSSYDLTNVFKWKEDCFEIVYE